MSANPAKILISACLLGEWVRYNGAAKRIKNPLLTRWALAGRLVPVCPEVAGGLPVPRDPCEIDGPGGGEAVLEGRALVRRLDGTDVTPAFLRGADLALAQCRQHKIRVAILKARSPSCSNGTIGDGRFRGHQIPGYGVTAALLRREGVRVFSEEELAQAFAYVEAEGTDTPS